MNHIIKIDQTKPFTHAEAFNLMFYMNKETKLGFVVWNSRDGVTPFIVFHEEKEYMHSYWQMDARSLNPRALQFEILKPGNKIFIDITPDMAREYAKKRIEHFKGTEFEVQPDSPRYNELIESLTVEFTGGPDMYVIQEGDTFDFQHVQRNPPSRFA